MKVYYKSGLWEKKQGLPGHVQPTDWTFEYAGKRRCIPAIYRFSKGIVFDLITLLEEAEFHVFVEKYEGCANSLTPSQIRCVEDENPYQAVQLDEIWLDGKQIEGWSSSSKISIPWDEEYDELSEIRTSYASALEGTTCFACERFCIPYQKSESFLDQLARVLRIKKIKHLKFTTRLTERFLPLDLQFSLQGDLSDAFVETFLHPKTGVVHTLYFQDIKHIKLPLQLPKTVDVSLHTVQVMYEIQPALSEGDRLQFSNSVLYDTAEMGFDTHAASSIGIIGGADGPTTIFCADKAMPGSMPHGSQGLPLHCCYAKPSNQEDDLVTVILEGINTKRHDAEEMDFYFSK